LLAVGLCGVTCAASAEDTSKPEHPSVSAAENRSPLVERQRNGISFKALKETLTGADEVFQKDCRNISSFISSLTGIERDKLLLMGVSILFCCAVMVFGFKKMKNTGKAGEQPQQQ